jgi:hypothetical protein
MVVYIQIHNLCVASTASSTALGVHRLCVVKEKKQEEEGACEIQNTESIRGFTLECLLCALESVVSSGNQPGDHGETDKCIYTVIVEHDFLRLWI